MAYNYFPFQGYSNNFLNNNPYAQMGASPQQSNGFISVRSVDEAINWPIAPGNSLTFKDESAPYIYTKTKGFSQLEQPIFERFRLVKEDTQPTEPQTQPQVFAESFDAKGQIEQLWDEVRTLKAELEGIKGKPKKAPAKKGESDDDQQ